MNQYISTSSWGLAGELRGNRAVHHEVIIGLVLRFYFEMRLENFMMMVHGCLSSREMMEEI